MPYTVYVGTRSGKVYKISDGSYTVVSKGDEVLQLIDGEKFSTLGVLYRYYRQDMCCSKRWLLIVLRLSW